MKIRESLTALRRLITFEVLVVIVGGGWTFFRYLSHEREALKLAIEQQRLATQQAAAVAKIQVAAENARLEQLRLTNQQSELAVHYAEKTQALAVEQQRIATQQGRLTLSIAESQRKLRDMELRQSLALQEQDLELKKLEKQRAAHDVDFRGKYRLEHLFTLNGKKRRDLGDADSEYEVTYGFQFVNRSEVPVEVSLFVIDYYIGTPSDHLGDKVSIDLVGSPTDRWNPRGAQRGALEWRLIGHTGSIYAAAVGTIPKPWDYAADVGNLRRGGGGTANLKATESLSYEDTYFVRAPRQSYVCYVISYCLNRCATNDDLYSRVDYLDLNKLSDDRSKLTP